MNDSASANILIVDDSPDMIQLMGRMLAGLGRLRFATSGPGALGQAAQMPPDLILLDAEMPGMDGFAVCAALKAEPLLSEIPVIFVTAHMGPEFELRCLEAGAVDFLSKPVNPPVLLARARTHLRLKQLTDALREMASIDALTGLANRRSFNEHLEREWGRCTRQDQPLSLLMVDVDHFKLFNDRYGHPAGDACLGSVAGAVRLALLRPGDMAARYGGEEFVLLLPNTPASGAMQIASRVQELVAVLNLPHETSPTASHVTVSIGAAWLVPDAGSRDASLPLPSADRLLACADTALYHAKKGGRNTVRGLDVCTHTGDDSASPSAEPPAS